MNRYRIIRNIAWILYIAALAVVFIFSEPLPGAGGSAMDILTGLMSVLIIGFAPMLMFTGIMTRKAREEDRRRWDLPAVKEMRGSPLAAYVTEKVWHGRETEWAEDFLMWLFGIGTAGIGIGSIAIDAGEQGGKNPAFLYIEGSIILAGLLIIALTYQRKHLRLLSQRYARAFCGHRTGDVLPESVLKAETGRRHPIRDLRVLWRRGYLINTDLYSRKGSAGLLRGMERFYGTKLPDASVPAIALLLVFFAAGALLLGAGTIALLIRKTGGGGRTPETEDLELIVNRAGGLAGSAGRAGEVLIVFALFVFFCAAGVQLYLALRWVLLRPRFALCFALAETPLLTMEEIAKHTGVRDPARHLSLMLKRGYLNADVLRLDEDRKTLHLSRR